MTDSSDRPIYSDASTLSEDHPAYATHQAAMRSVQRVIENTAPYQNVQVASTGIGQLLRLKPLVLTGAGMSTDSGIPDYRGPEGSLRHSRPMTYQEFLHDDAARHRYWARSFVGWQHMNAANPHAGHNIIAKWNTEGHIAGVVTQNVDGLHQQSQRVADQQATHGSEAGPIIALHGSMDEIECLVCGVKENREDFGIRLREANAGVADHWQISEELINPDGDARIPQDWVEQFQMVHCLNCGSDKLKPTVVYFGEIVPKQRKEAIQTLLDRSGALIVIGSSLAVMSGYRILLEADRARKPIGIINLGPTRGEERATFRWRSGVKQALEWLDQEISSSSV
ncbi:Sir2 family NAD-dependent protein deacetylase [Enteractinococcus helveticum]|uniref:protein acetyllysine N-acetyltransferase n=1 Tax=Enteractinococcus helveticum TaxID=1837282 RepID=A0A1B7LVS9_9MICC|nr:Sir2 family NAD-dependent protein deacetylase [Enteractinococcus helveticum]OAV59148.1 NAD-dependent protein deacetylase [Enteractinococcus helveticum]